jgi:hypothetical protein
LIDLTILYITANRLPRRWVRFQLRHLLDSADDAPVVVASRKPMGGIGENLIDTEKPCYWNIYRQMLRAAKVAKTKYVAMAEDDTLYTRTHFIEFRPPVDAVAYDHSRWSLFACESRPFYCMRQRISNCSLIAPRDYLIDALEERETKYPDGNDYVGEVGRPDVEKRLGVSPRNKVEFYSFGPIVQLNHIDGGEDRQRQKWKRHGQMRAYDIPYWGKAEDIVRIYNGR